MANSRFQRCALAAAVLLFVACEPVDSEVDPEADGLVVADSTVDMSTESADAGQAESCEVIAQAYSPFESDTLQQFPDDLLTTPDDDSPTGLRLTNDASRFPWLGNLAPLIAQSFPDLSKVSGFSRVGRVFVSFEAPVLPADSTQAPNPEGITLLDMTSEPPIERPFVANWGPDRQALFVRPLTPLLPGHRHALVVTSTVLESESTCLRPSETLSSILGGTEIADDFAPLQARYQAALRAADVPVDDVVAATVFTTHRDLEVLTDIAEEIEARQFEWGPDADCSTDGEIRTCETTFRARDYRDDRAILTARPTDSWVIPVTIHAPVDQDGPLPVILYGHGLNSSRSESRFLAEQMAEDSFIVVAIDALHHGDHPTRVNPDELAALNFLAIYISRLSLDGLAMRGNFNQTNLDRLQLLRLIRTQPDFDEDGQPDFDPAIITYFGASLGGMLGSTLLSLDPTIKAGVFAVAGGQLIGFVTGTETIAMFQSALVNLFGSEGNLERMLVVLQSLVDAGDPATHAPQVLQRRNPDHGSEIPHILLPVAMEDDTVPPHTGEALARALGLPHIEPVANPVLGLSVEPAGASLNSPTGTATIGYFQFDRITRGGNVRAPSHSGTPASDEAILQLREFLGPLRSGDAPRIIDPYEALGTPAR